MKRLIKKLIICFIVFGLFCSHVIAAPIITGVSGTVATGQNIIISGSSFGTKSPAAPLSFLNFEDALVGTISNPYRGWTPSSGGGSTHWPIVVWTYRTFGASLKIFDIAQVTTTKALQFRHAVLGPGGRRKRIHHDVLYLRLIPAIPATIIVVVSIVNSRHPDLFLAEVAHTAHF